MITGSLIVSQKLSDNDEDVHMFTAHSGEIVGGLAVITGEPSFFTIRAKHQSRIGLLEKTVCYRYHNYNVEFIFKLKNYKIVT